MTVSRLLLISHAATEAQRRTAFPCDEPLLERELARSRSLAWSAPARARIWTAPERRARQTSRMLGLSATPAAELRECDYGGWCGRTMEEVQAGDPEGTLAWLTDPGAAPHGGESLESLAARVGRWMDEECTARETVAVTHPSVIRAAIVHGLRTPVQLFWRFDIPPLTLVDLRSHGVWTLRCLGCPLDRTEAESPGA